MDEPQNLSGDFKKPRFVDFAKDIDQLIRTHSGRVGLEDYHHLRRFHWLSFIFLALGYAISWFAVNPLSWLFLGIGNHARWSLIYHHVAHGSLDSIPGVPFRYTSKGFAKGWRRFLDWPDWIVPNHWEVEHNQLHHYHLGTDKDPHILEHNTRFLNAAKGPVVLKFLSAILLSVVWKPFYYAPNAFIKYLTANGGQPVSSISIDIWSPFRRNGFRFWSQCLIPYIFYRFFLVPLFFLPLGIEAALLVLVNSVGAEVVANFVSFAAIASSHAGTDIPLFDGTPKSKGEHYYRQIVGTVNYPAGNHFYDFLHSGLNYHIEHHLWPKGTLHQYRLMRPELKKICKRYGVPYKEKSLILRVKKTFQVVVGI